MFVSCQFNPCQGISENCWLCLVTYGGWDTHYLLILWENSKPSLVDWDFHHELRLIMSLQPNSIEPFVIMVNQSMLCHCSLSSCLGQLGHLSCLHPPKKNPKEQVLLLKLLWGSEHFSPGSHRKLHFTRKSAPLELLKQSQTLTFRAETKRPLAPCPWHLSATDTRASCSIATRGPGGHGGLVWQSPYKADWGTAPKETSQSTWGINITPSPDSDWR